MGSELCGNHLVVIIQNKKANIYSEKVNVLPIEGDGTKINPNYQVRLSSAELADGKLKLECSPPVPEGMSPEETEKYLYDYIIRHDWEVFLSSMDPVTYGLTPELRKMIYKVDRIIANEKA